MTQLINLTPHAIDVNGQSIAPSGKQARVSVSRSLIGQINGINIYTPTFGDVIGLPDQAPDTYYIVSAMVAAAAKDRKDLLTPGTPIRDADGKIIGCDGLNEN
jgi:hypothetical protein